MQKGLGTSMARHPKADVVIGLEIASPKLGADRALQAKSRIRAIEAELSIEKLL